MKNLFAFTFLVILFLPFQTLIPQEKTYTLSNNFDKLIVSPHIEVEFVRGNKSKIEVQEILVPLEKLNYEISNKTLQIYLEGAKTVTKHKAYNHNGWKQKHPIYKSTVAKVKITYANVDVFSIRGEEKITFESPLNQKKCMLRIYGESEVLVKTANINDMRVAIYGESHLVINSGAIINQRITAYGSSVVEALNVSIKQAKVTAYGEGTYQLNVSGKLKVTSYGESKILYKGNAYLKKGIVIGKPTIAKI